MPRRPGRARTRKLVVAGMAATGLAAFASRSPWPRVLVLRAAIRLTGADEAPRRADRLRALVPPGVESTLDVVYDAADRDARLDVFRPAGDGPLATVVWVHGGAWIGGSKNDLRDYLRILASHGVTAVGVEYSHAPRRHYPTPVRQVARALEHLTSHAHDLGIDPGRIVLAGDSAGAHIAAQTALAIVDEDYARGADLPRPVPPDSLVAALLFCGPYAVVAPDDAGPYGQFLRTILWAYSGRRDFATDPRFAWASLIDHVTGQFPPTFITAGNGDPLVGQSVRMARALRHAGVATDELFFPRDHEPPVPHEYQLDLHTEAGRQALDRTVDALRRWAGPLGTDLWARHDDGAPGRPQPADPSVTHSP